MRSISFLQRVYAPQTCYPGRAAIVASSMADQPIPVRRKCSAEPLHRKSPGFPERGVPVFSGFNRLGLWTLYMKEVRRFFKVQTQDDLGPGDDYACFI